MYESFYQLQERPFSLLPDPDYLYRSDRHGTALALLEYSLLNRTGFCVISGEAGTGKTTLIRYVLAQCADSLRFGLISNTHRSFDELLTWIFLAFGLDYQGKTKLELYDGFIQFVIDQYAKNRQTVLVIDEAQNMSPETLEELRMLSNVNSEKDQVLQMILVGQPGLSESLRQPGLEQFAQRIAVNYHLEPLGREETAEYIRHRLAVAGGVAEIFDETACEAVFHYSRGIPRLINLLCDNTLVYGFAQQQRTVNAEIVRHVINDREAHGTLPRFASDTEEIPDSTVSQDVPVAYAVEPATPLSEKELSTSASCEIEATPVDQEEELLQASQGAMQIGSAGGKAVPPLVQSPTAVSLEAASSQPPAVISKLVTMDAWLRKSPRSGTRQNAETVLETRKPSPAAVAVQSDASVDPNVKQPAVSAGDDDWQPAYPGESAVPGESSVGDHLEGGADMVRDDLSADRRERRSRAFWGAAAALGFVGGLLVAAILIGAVYLRLGPAGQRIPLAVPSKTASLPSASPAAVSPPAAPSVPVAPAPAAQPPTASVAAKPVDHIRLRELKRERDAALAEARALEKERDAALAVANAREQATSAELHELRAEERAKMAEIAAKAAQNRAQAERVSAPAKPQVSPAAAAKLAAASQPKTAAVAVAQKPVAPSPVGHKSAPLTFSANPCKGPSAKFLSTCKE